MSHSLSAHCLDTPLHKNGHSLDSALLYNWAVPQTCRPLSFCSYEFSLFFCKKEPPIPKKTPLELLCELASMRDRRMMGPLACPPRPSIRVHDEKKSSHLLDSVSAAGKKASFSARGRCSCVLFQTSRNSPR